MTPRPSNRRGRPDSDLDRLVTVVLIMALAALVGGYGLSEIIADVWGSW